MASCHDEFWLCFVAEQSGDGGNIWARSSLERPKNLCCFGILVLGPLQDLSLGSFGPKMIGNLPIITQYIANDTSPRHALPKRRICSDRRHDISRELCSKLFFKSHCVFSHDLSQTFRCLRFLFCEHPFTRDLSPAFSADLQVCCFLEL